jgi:hypothetical protein
MLGTYLLGSQFLQDSNPNWIKINSIVIGESTKFSYKISWSRDIVSLLNSLSKDPYVTCVLYHWKTGDAYIKTGFDLSDKSDYKYDSEYTTFIVKNKINQFV